VPIPHGAQYESQVEEEPREVFVLAHGRCKGAVVRHADQVTVACRHATCTAPTLALALADIRRRVQ